ncbi:hypothetical protein ZWY2020_059812 [Hordeum vulgare]|nr:hypothetical protein ZWY2020_059812 [Hordeum vulgare]
MVRLPYLTSLTTPFSYGLLFPFGHFRDFFRRILDADKSNNLKVLCPVLTLLVLSVPQGYAPICLGYEDFYRRRLYLRIQGTSELQRWKVQRLLREGWQAVASYMFKLT